MNRICDAFTNFVMTPNISAQTAMYSIPFVNLFVRQFQYYHCFEDIEKKAPLTAENFNEQQTKFQKGLKTGLQIQIAIAIATFALCLLFPVPSTAFLLCSHVSRVFLRGAFSLYILDAFWKIPLCQRRYSRTEGNLTTVVTGG
jgi:hypothetical protein